MAFVILLCGRIASGKTTYYESLRGKRPLLLSADEAMLVLYPAQLGEKHAECQSRVEEYLKKLALRLLESGEDVCLDWGFWEKRDREQIRLFFESRGYRTELHFLDVSRQTWEARVRKRNAEVLSGRDDAYFVDDTMKRLFYDAFERPDGSEIEVFCMEDVIIRVIPEEEKRNYWDLLLLADPEKQAVEKYLSRGEMLGLFEGELCCAELVVTDEGEGVCELKNVATREDRQRRGYARRLIGFAVERCRERYSRMLVGTADASEGPLRLYRSCGFQDDHVISNFFVEQYEEPVFENGVRLVDMICLSRPL